MSETRVSLSKMKNAPDVADHQLAVDPAGLAPKMRIAVIRYRAIEQPLGKPYSSRHIEVEAEIPHGACPRREADLLDQAVSARLGVKPMRRQLAEQAVTRLEWAKEDADRAASRLAGYVVTVEKMRIRVQEAFRALEEARATLDALEADAEKAAARVARRPSRLGKKAVEEVSKAVHEAAAKVDQLDRSQRAAQDQLGTYERELAEIEKKSRGGPHAIEIEEARAALQAVIADLQRNQNALPL